MEYFYSEESDIELSILYYSLEENKNKVILAEISKYLHAKYNIIVSVKELQSIGRYNTLSRDTLEKVKEAEEYINNFLEVVDIQEFIRNPTGIYKNVRDFALKVGTYYDSNHKPLSKQDIEDVKKGRNGAYKKISYYKKHNPKHYVIVITDHISLLEQEKDEGTLLTQWQTIQKFSNKYCLHLRDKFGFTVVNVQQQASSKEQVEYNYQGKTIDEKLQPSLEALGDCKITQRDCDIAIGLFAPHRYGIEKHNGYDIKKFKDYYRSLSILKSRDGVANMQVGLFFNGASDFFRELPRPDDKENLSKVEDYIKEIELKKQNQVKA